MSEMMNGVQQVLKTTVPYPLASRQANPAGTVVTISDVAIGGKALVVIAGNTRIANEAQALAAAAAVRRTGASIFRGTVTPQARTNTRVARIEDSLRWLRSAATRHGLKLLCEIADASELELIDRYADMYEVGERNMQNFTLLRELGRTDRPVLLRRGAGATIEEWLLAAEYLLAGGNVRVVLCEGGIRTFEGPRRMLDVSAIPVVKALSHLPVVVDPGHATGRRECIAPMAKASVAAGADGFMIEVQTDGDGAVGGGRSAVSTTEFDRLVAELEAIATTVERDWARSPALDGCAATPDPAWSLG